MKIGLSTASLYPMHTEEALLETARLGVKNVEIFLGSVSELEGEIFSSMKKTVADYGLNVLSVHPFSSPMESLFLFSSYDRRVNDIMDMYKRYFAMMNELDAKIFVVHGATRTSDCPDGRYVERLHGLIEAGRKFGVTVAQENVSYCKSGQSEFLQLLARELADSIAFVLDIKQARRSGDSPQKLAEILRDKIVHLHLSDGTDGADRASGKDCMLIGRGDFDFAAFFAFMREVGYKGDAVVELYRDNYGDYGELVDCVDRLRFMDSVL